MGIHNDDEIAMAEAPRPGVWLLASFCTSCDQTVASLIELARFYPEAIAPDFALALRETFPRSRKNNAQAIERLCSLFQPASHAALQAERPGCPYTSQIIAMREASSAAEYLGWILHPAPPGPSGEPSAQWGAFELFVMDYEFLPPPAVEGQEPYYGSLDASDQAALMSAAMSHCAATLDAAAAALGFGAPALMALDGEITPAERPLAPAAPSRYTERPRWGQEWLPHCLQDDLRRAAEALLERRHLEDSASPASPAPSRAPRV